MAAQNPSETKTNILLTGSLPGDLIALEAAVGELGHNLVHAGSRAEALRLLRNGDCAAVLLGVEASGLEWLETAKLIRSGGRSRRTPIIFLAACDPGRQALEQAYSLSWVDHLVEPLVPAALRAKVAAWVELSQAKELLARPLEGARLAERALEERLRQKNEELAQANRRKDEFLAVLAHELRNALAPTRNALQVLRLAQGDQEAARRAREMAERQVEQMARLVDDLLDVSRISWGKVELRKELVELAAVVRRAVDTSAPLVEAAGHELTVALPDCPLWLEADPARLVQVLSNLLNNAAKYTERGGRIWLAAQRDGQEAVLRVRDTGLGIPPELMPRLFDLFSQADRTLERSQGGLGIGLSLVRRLVELHGGAVEAQSEGSGRGSTFTVRLPLMEGPQEAAPPAPATQAAADASPCRVLVVDDNRQAAESLALLMQMWGHDARTATDGRVAIQLADSFRPDVVFLDLGLPGMDGCEVARELRKLPGLGGAVLVALTGYGGEADRRRCAEAGFDRHLLKPPDLDAVQALLARLASGRGGAVGAEPPA